MDNKDLTEFGRRESLRSQEVKDVGQPTHAKKYKYSQDRAHIIITYLLKGTTIQGACKAAGISDRTFYRWKDEIDEFRDMIHAAESDIEAALVESIVMDDDWRAKAWILERRFRDGWSAKQEVDVTIKKQTGDDVVKGMLKNITQQKENLIDQESEDQ